MKKLLLTIAALSMVVFVCHAQQYYNEEGTRQEREFMLMDGANPNFVLATQLTPTQLAVGIPIEGQKGDGVYELRNDTCIWITHRLHGDDEQLAVIRYNADDENLMHFVYTDFENPETSAGDAIGAINLLSNEIYLGEAKEPIAQIYDTGELVAPDGKLYLYTNGVAKPLAAFFFLHFYIPQNGQ